MQEVEQPFLVDAPTRGGGGSRREILALVGAIFVLGAFSGSRAYLTRSGAPHVGGRVAELSTSQKVTVELYGMAGCPFTRGFIEGPLAETLATVPDLVDFHFHPFGNCYFVTEECGGNATDYTYDSYFKGYNQTVRQCWDDLCGAGSHNDAEDCFSGPLLCQHGATDAMLTTAWACALDQADNVASDYMPFVLCSVQKFLGITSEATFLDLVDNCAGSTGLDQADMRTCAIGSAGRSLLQVQGRMTLPHPACPYVLIDGKVLHDTSCVACGDGIMQKVCEAMRAKYGVITAECAGIFR